MKRRTKILLLLVFALILGFIILLPHGGYRRAVAAYKKQLIAQGEKLTMAELAPAPSTNGSNAAIALTNAMEGYRLPSDYPPMMKIIGPGIAMIGHSNPKPVELAGYASNIVKAAELRAILQAPLLDFNLDYSKGVEIPLYHLFKLKAADTLLCITATQALHEKNYSEAWSDLLAAVEIPRLFNNEPVMFSDLVRIAIARNAISATWETLHSDHQWSAPQLAELQAKWEAMDLIAHAESVMAMERAWGIEGLAEFRKTNDLTGLALTAALISNSTGVSQDQNDGGGWVAGLRDKLKELYNRYPRLWLWKSSWSYDEELYNVRLYTLGKEAARQMRVNGAFVPFFNDLKMQTTNLLKLHPYAKKHFLLTGVGETDISLNYVARLAVTETRRRLMVTAISLERYRSQHNAYPARLGELVPNYLRQVPADFMDGKPLRYQLKSDGNFLLYSVGEDGHDDGGDSSQVSSSTDLLGLSSRDVTRDIVWPRAATPQELADYLARQPAQTNSPAK